MTTTPTQPAPLDDAGAMAVLVTAAARIRNTEPLVDGEQQKGLCISMAAQVSAARAHLAARLYLLGGEIDTLNKRIEALTDQDQRKQAAVIEATERAIRAEAELANANFAVTELREELASLRTYAAANADRASRAEAELAAVRANAERYAWLRSRVSWQRPGDEKPWTTPSGVYLVATMVSAVYGNCDEQTDAAIDAARGAG